MNNAFLKSFTTLQQVYNERAFSSIALNKTLHFCKAQDKALITKIPQYSFYDLVSNAMNKWVAKLAYILLFVYFFVKMSIALTEIHDYYTSSLFEELNPYFV